MVVTAAVLLAVWWPARPGGTDGFPLSSYPMFGYARAYSSRVDTVLGVRADGRRVPLTPILVGGTGRSKQALATVQAAVVEGRTAGLCREVAGRVSAGVEALEPVIALEVVTDTWDTLGSLEPGAAPRERRVHARCEVR